MFGSQSVLFCSIPSGRGRGQSSCPQSKNISLRSFVQRDIVVFKTGKGQTQTVETKLETHYCLKYHYMLSDFPSLEPRDPQATMKNSLRRKNYTGQCPHTFNVQCIIWENKPCAAAVGLRFISRSVSEQTTATTRLHFLGLTFSQGGRFLHGGVNEGDAARTSHRGVCCVRRAADGENDRKQLLGLSCFSRK